MATLYILYSAKLDRYYVGQSADVQARLLQHNHSENHNWTKVGIPWVLKAVIEYPHATLARKAEYWLKQQKSKLLLEEIITERNKEFLTVQFKPSSDC